MLSIADFLVAGFIFLLFVSIYRKRSTTAVRFWVAGWFCVLVHFGVLLLRPQTEPGMTLKSIAALSTLVLCGTSFALSRPGGQLSRRRQLWIAGLLGVPWLLVMVLGSLPGQGWFRYVAALAWFSEVCMVEVALQLLGLGRRRSLAVLGLVLACAAWLIITAKGQDPGMVQCVALTQCFGLNAVLLAGRSRRYSAANLTLTVGSAAWASVWAAAVLVQRYMPALNVSPEIWNLPKYFVAAGMVLRLLDEEIRGAELASEQYRLLFAGNPQPMWIYDAETLAFLEVNDAAVAHYGFSRGEFQGLTLLDVVELGEEADLAEDLRTSEPQMLSGPWLHRRKGGHEFQVDVASQPVMRGAKRATFALMHDVTESQRLHAQLIRQAHHDALTGLPNGAYFEQTLQTTLDEAARQGSRVALFCMDLDRFKQINDTFGHAAGDQCLRALAQRISRSLGGRGTLARTGGDEFMLVFGNLSCGEDAEVVAAQLLAELRPPLAMENAEVELLVSIGIALYPDDADNPAQLWRDADAAMYRAKRAGGGQWIRTSQEISNAASEANDIEVSLRRVLKKGEITLFYQPQMTLTGALHSLEALVRFADPVLARATADRVIAIAEESGLIVPLGDRVLEEVCRQSREWIDAGFRPVQIAVNVSPLQLNRSNLSLRLASLLQQYRLRPCMLELEVTESTMMPEKGDAPAQIATLAEMGIAFSVDDFGKGYSSLGRLHQLPVDALKIDCSFTRRLTERKGTYPTVRAIIALAHTLGMQVVAEGVETEEQLQMLRSMECDRVQGYLFSRPLPAGQVQRFFSAADASSALPGGFAPGLSGVASVSGGLFGGSPAHAQP